MVITRIGKKARRGSAVACVAAALAAASLVVAGCAAEVRDDASGGDGDGASTDDGETDDGDGSDGADGGDGSDGGTGESCSVPEVSEVFEGGAYFFVVDVEAPIPTQLQLLAWFDVDPDRGVVRVRFTNADRAPGSECGCGAAEACSSSRGCVTPSEKALSADEYVDFVPNPDRPDGYSFATTACTVDEPDGAVSLTTVPVDLVIEQPPVTIVATRLAARFAVGDDAVLRGSGTFEGERVLLSTVESGPASGTLLGRRIPDAEVPSDLPKP